jgi:isopenicillin N synthase-like dioxygenase
MSSNVPVIDFAKFSDNHDIAERLSIARSLVLACQQVGFVYIISHGLSKNQIDNAFATSKRLFVLGHETKMQAPHPDGPAVHRVYSYPGLEKVSQYAGGEEEVGEQLREVAGCKESYEIGSEENKEQPNVWLPEETLPGFVNATSTFYWECNKVAQSVLHALALGIGPTNPTHLTNYHSGHNNQLRFLHYPPIAAADLESERVARMPAHTDWSTITLLFQDDCGGLQIQDPHQAGSFVPATPMKDACVMNVGDLLMRWSNGRRCKLAQKSVVTDGRDRYSGVITASCDAAALCGQDPKRRVDEERALLNRVFRRRRCRCRGGMFAGLRRRRTSCEVRADHSASVLPDAFEGTVSPRGSLSDFPSRRPSVGDIFLARGVQVA